MGNSFLDNYEVAKDPAAPAPAPAAPKSFLDAYDLAPQQAPPRAAVGAVESIQAGLQASAPGLAWRGKLPDLVMNPEHAKWWERALTGISQVAAELPIMAVGAAAGAPVGAAAGTALAPGAGTAVGSVLGAGAGMFGVPAAIRESLVQAYKSGEVKTAADFWNILKEVAGTTAKEAAIGAATMGAGGIAARTVGKALVPAIGESVSVPAATKIIGASDVAAQIATMTTMPAALQGRLPDLQEIMDAAIVVGGLKGAHMAAERITSTYLKTGKTPAEQVADVQNGVTTPADFVGPPDRPTMTVDRNGTVFTGETAARATAAAENRLTELMVKTETEPLTDAERAERVFLTNNLKNPTALARFLGVEGSAHPPKLESESAQRVYDDVLQQLRDVDQARIDTGRTPLGDDHALAVAALVKARVRTRAARLGLLPEDVYAERPLQFRDDAQIEAAAAEAPAGAPTFTPPEVDLFGNTVEVTNAPRYGVEGMATVETPLEGLVLSKEVPQFKKNANDEGVVAPLGGTFDRTGVGPIQVWERTDGTREVISGRHRLDLAKRSGETTIPAQIHREAEGFTARQAAVLDAMLNIREEQGSIADYVQYFKDSGITREAADLEGLLARAKGRTAFAISRDATDDLAAAHRAGLLSDEAALAISAAAPSSDRLQALGIAMVNEGKSALIAVNTMKAVELMAGDRLAAGAQGDIFGFDDSAMQEASAMAKKATSIQRKISEQISAVSGASRRPELARKMGVDVADPEGIQKRIVQLRQEQYLWDNWPIHPDLVAQLRDKLKQGPVPNVETPAEATARDAEAAGQALRKDEPLKLFQSKEPFYSELARQIDASKLKAAGPEQWKGTIKNLKGVKADEVEASGINEWLDTRDGKVTKDEVAQFLSGNGVKVTEVMKGGNAAPSAELATHIAQRGLIEPQTPEGWTDLSDLLMDQAQKQQSRGEDAKANELFSMAEEAGRLAEGLDAAGSTEGAPKFGQYVLPGGENYRELLLTLPTKESATPPRPELLTELPEGYEPIHDASAIPSARWGVVPPGQVHARPMGGRYATKEEAIADALNLVNNERLSNWAYEAKKKADAGAFISSHFDAANILAHIRFNDRTDADGKRVLFLEEIQSDWAQQGKKKGFSNALPTAPRGRAELDNPQSDGSGIPSAPFVTKTEAWTGLALKRMIRYAAEHDYDRIAWTTGEQQVERYTSALRKAVDQIEWTKTDKGVQLVGYKTTVADYTQRHAAMLGVEGNDRNARTKVVDTTEKEDALSDSIGKAMAEKIINDPAQTGTIEGAGLKIDSTGMAAFYNRILPNVANKIIGKLGGNRVEDIPFKYSAPWSVVKDGDFWALERQPSEVHGTTRAIVQSGFASAAEADATGRDAFPSGTGTAETQTGFQITPEMKNKALEGLPLFQHRQETARGSYEPAENLIEFMQNADRSTAVHELWHSWLEEMKADALRPDAPLQIKADWDVLRRELAIPESGDISRASHEQLARSGERYLMEGEAPSRELQTIFAKFKAWLLAIYESVRNLNVEINPELRAVMDRMLATDAEIADARELDVPRAYVNEARAAAAEKIVPGPAAKKPPEPGFVDEQLAVEPLAEELLAGPGSGSTNDSRVNAKYINGPLDFKLAIQRVSELDQQNIQGHRGGTGGVKSWAEANAEVDRLAEETMGGKLTADVFPPGTSGAPPHDIQQRAAFRVMIAIAKHSMALRDSILEKGHDASVQDQFDYLSSIVRMRMAHAEFLGLRAASARALNQIKDMTPESGVISRMVEMTGGDSRLFQSGKTPAEEAAALKLKLDEIMAQHFSGKSALDIAKLQKDIKSLKGQLALAKEVTDATKWEMVVEGWKAGLLSGPQTPVTNVVGTWSFQQLRAPIDALAAIIGMARGASPGMGESDRASMSEALARITGPLSGVQDGLKLAWAALKADEPTEKVESFRGAIPGRAGELVRFPFRFMSAGDLLTTTMYKRGELKTLAIRTAFDENLNPGTREFAERVQHLVDNPTEQMTTEAEAAADRMSFNMPGGEKTVAVQSFVKNWGLQWMVPFIRTPINIAAEMIRMTPGAPLVADWRADILKGGVARDRAIAEVVVGSGIMALTMAYAFDGQISGSGSPDAGKNRGKAGVWQPNSVLVGDKWYEIGRLQPGGTLMVLAADVAMAWDHMTPEEQDKVPKILAMAFSNAITNQTFLQGITNVVHMMSEPDRYGARFAQGLAASMVPNVIGQPTAMADPYMREVNSMLEAIQSRIPGMRQNLIPKKDWLGEAVATKERMGVVLPVRELEVSKDKVRLEAARLDISMAAPPKKTHIGTGTGKLGDVELTPEERAKFEEVGGKMAHEILTNIVAAPGYDAMPDIIKRRVFAKVLTAAHRVAAFQALPPDKRQGYLQEITEKLATELTAGN